MGLFTVPLAHRFERVIAVESNEAAARDLEANLQESGASSPALRQTDVEAFLARWHEAPDLVVLDPPRAGVAAQRSHASDQARARRRSLISRAIRLRWREIWQFWSATPQNRAVTDQ